MSSPDRAKIGRELYQLVLLKVESKDEFGRPKSVTVVYDDTVVNIQGGEEFITTYVPATVVQTWPGKVRA